ncbi:MAG: prepilin peptidase [Limnohabitans sp.]|jgi:leader peptidase (prepilin peptidase)/N-methyltransferase
MSTPEILLVLALGLVVGSFLNVVVYRLPRMLEGESNEALSLPSSHCPTCKTPIKVWHNIPLLSYVLLKGRCSSCQAPIHWQYPAVELTNACLWLLCAWHWGMHPNAFAWAVCMSLLLALSVIDWQTTYLPDALTQPLLWIGLLASSLNLIDVSVQHAVWGAVAGYASLWLVATVFEKLTGKEGMGAGDFKLLASLGAWLGPFALIPLVLMASVSGAMVGFWMQSTNRLERGGYVPFGPFLAAAGAVQAFYGGADVFFYINWLL